MVRTCIVMLVAVIFTGPGIDALKLPSYLAPCSRNDPNLNECSLKSALAGASSLFKGDRTYNIPVLDPLRITEIKIEDTSADRTGLDITFNDLDLYGLPKVEIVKTDFDLKNKKINLDLSFANTFIKSKYVVNGKILILPIKGNGDCFLNMTKPVIKVMLDYELVTKEDGKEHMSVTGSKLDFNIEKLDIYLDNLFNGDKALGDNTNKFLNENWEILNKDFGPYIAEGIEAAIKQIATGLMDKVPYDDFFPVSV